MPVTISEIKADDYLVTKEIEYVDVHRILQLFSKIAFKINVILTGETGIGKSSAIAKYARATQTPLITHWCSEDQRREHLIGHLTMADSVTTYHYGPLPRAIAVANAFGKAILLLEELNGLTPQSQKLLNPLTDWHREVVTDYGTEKLNPGAQLWIVGAMNSAGYGGIYALNDDLKSRFRIIPLGYPKQEDERAMAEKLVPGASKEMVTKVLTLAEMTRKSQVDYRLSPRDVLDILRDTSICGLGEALRLQSGKFEGGERAVFLQWCKSTFTEAMLKAKP